MAFLANLTKEAGKRATSKTLFDHYLDLNLDCRCVLNNPCEHKCIDTGVAVKCSCYEGFELQKDKKSCIGMTIKALKTTFINSLVNRY